MGLDCKGRGLEAGGKGRWEDYPTSLVVILYLPDEPIPHAGPISSQCV